MHGHDGLLPKLDLFYLLRYILEPMLPNARMALWRQAQQQRLAAAAAGWLAWDEVGRSSGVGVGWGGRARGIW